MSCPEKRQSIETMWRVRMRAEAVLFPYTKYQKEAMHFLSDEEYYRRLEENLFPTLQTNICNLLTEAV